MIQYLLKIPITFFVLLPLCLAYGQEEKSSFNIAVAADWGCDDAAKQTVQNMQNKNPELVIANGDLSYKNLHNVGLN